MASRVIGVLGATSLVGDYLLATGSTPSLDADVEFVAFSRRSVDPNPRLSPRVTWCCLPEAALQKDVRSIEYWICLAPVWILPEYYSLLESRGARRVVVLSSTSRFTKTESSDLTEQGVAAALLSGERQLIEWAEQREIAWIILRPTLIYGSGRDKNISSIAGFIRRFGFFPLLGAAQGLRQPIHAGDVATACFQALSHSEVVNQAYNITGAETLTYDEMVRRVFDAMGKKPRFLHIHRIVFRLAVALSQFVPRYRNVSIGMAERMNRDLIFDHSDAVRDFCFNPGPFHLHRGDVEKIV
ncbi:MAG: NAD-dependent epimerase/dehydratase family protein [Thiogranum sp.]